jgi:hypothetical protein
MPTSTAVICPKCSKVSYLAGDSSDVEKTCSACGSQLVQQPKQPKFCIVCGKDITARRRMKDRQGRYFCYECGIADNKRKEQTESYPCTMCRRPFTKEKMVERDGTFFCKRCYGVKLLEFKEEEEQKVADAKKGPDEKKKKRKKLFMIVGANVVIVIFMLIQLNVIKISEMFEAAAPPASVKATTSAKAQSASSKQTPAPAKQTPAPRPAANKPK